MCYTFQLCEGLSIMSFSYSIARIGSFLLGLNETSNEALEVIDCHDVQLKREYFFLFSHRDNSKFTFTNQGNVMSVKSFKPYIKLINETEILEFAIALKLNSHTLSHQFHYWELAKVDENSPIGFTIIENM